MKYIIQTLEAEQIQKNHPDFRAGDTIIVNVKIKEGTRERLQAFEGVVIARRNRGFNSAFTVRKISHGEGVERTFGLYSPLIDTIQLKRRGDIRQSKIYWLRDLRGKAARIKEKLNFKNKKATQQLVQSVVLNSDLKEQAPS